MNIRLRAWDKEYSQMIYDFESDQSIKSKLKIAYEDDHLFCYGNTKQNQYKQLPLMQFCGFHDKKANPVFEGDIIEYFPCESIDYNIEQDHEQILNNPQRSVIQWSDAAIGFRLKASCRFTITAQMMEVVGNIYEHPNRNPEK